MGYAKRENVPAKVKVAIEFLIQQKNDLAAAALHAGVSLNELRRSLKAPQVRRYALEQRQLALETLCLGNPAALQKVRDESENGMAIVGAVKAAEQLRVGAIEAEASAQRRAPGLSIVLVQGDGGRLTAFEPPKLLDVTPVPEAVPVIRPDAEAE
jgi:hypothetical protein